MADDTTRILALESRLDDVQRTLLTHDLLIRALLVRLAAAEPEAFGQIARGLTGLKFAHESGAGGELPAEVAEELAQILGEVSRGATRRG